MKAPFRIAHEYCVETGKDKYWAEQLCSFLWFSWYEYIGSLNMYSSTLNVIRNKYDDITPIDEYTWMLEPGSLQFAQAQIDVAMQMQELDIQRAYEKKHTKTEYIKYP